MLKEVKCDTVMLCVCLRYMLHITVLSQKIKEQIFRVARKKHFILFVIQYY